MRGGNTTQRLLDWTIKLLGNNLCHFPNSGGHYIAPLTPFWSYIPYTEDYLSVLGLQIAFLKIYANFSGFVQKST